MHELVAKRIKFALLPCYKIIIITITRAMRGWHQTTAIISLQPSRDFAIEKGSRSLRRRAPSIRSERTKEAQHLCLTPKIPSRRQSNNKALAASGRHPLLTSRYNDDATAAIHLHL